MGALEQLDELRQAVTDAEHRAREVVAAEKAAKAELRDARANLAQVEVDGASKEVETARRRLEKARIGVEIDPWPDRLKLAEGHVRRAERQVREFIAAHFVELLEAKEAEAETPAAKLVAACQTIIDADLELARISGEVSSLWMVVTQPQQGDVSRTDTQKLVSEANALIERGSEGPTLHRGRMAWVLGLAEEPVPA